MCRLQKLLRKDFPDYMKRNQKRNSLSWLFYFIVLLLILILIELVVLCVTIVRRGNSQTAQVSQTAQTVDAGQTAEADSQSGGSTQDPEGAASLTEAAQTDVPVTEAPQTEAPQTEAVQQTEAPQTDDAQQTDDDLLLILVNASHPLPENIQVEQVTLSNGKQVAALIYPDLQRMFDAARAQNIYPTVTEGYRTHEDQVAMMQLYIDRYIAEGYSESDAQTMALDYVAVPGTSEHELGIALDINSQDGNTDWNVYEWLKNNAHNYGFILRYPEGKEDITGIDYEPWHYRYVGETAAREIYERQITLEEYLMQ